MVEDLDLREHLQQLHKELAQTETVDEKSRVLLTEVLDDIRGVLDRSGDDATRGPLRLSERLAEATRDWETSHPVLATAVGRVADTLSNLGI